MNCRRNDDGRCVGVVFVVVINKTPMSQNDTQLLDGKFLKNYYAVQQLMMWNGYYIFILSNEMNM